MSGERVWELYGEDWRLPVFADADGAMVRVRLVPDLPLLKKQRAAILDRLKPMIHSEIDGRIWVHGLTFKKCAVPSAHSDPEDVVEWPGAGQDVPMTAQPATTKDGDALGLETVERYCKSRFAVVTDTALFDCIFISFIKFMADELVNKRRPVDLVLLKLFPLVGRRNCLNVMARVDRNVGGKRRFYPSVQSMLERGLLDEMTSGNMVAVNVHTQPKVATWTIDVLLQSPWEKLTLAAEKRRFAMCFSNEKLYWASVLDELKRQIPMVTELYEHYINEASRPCAKFRQNGRLVGSKVYKAPGKVKRSGYTGSFAVGKGCVVALAADKKCAFVEVKVDSEAEGLPTPVPNLQSIDPDMWERYGNVEGPDREGAIFGVPLPDGTQSGA